LDTCEGNNIPMLSNEEIHSQILPPPKCIAIMQRVSKIRNKISRDVCPD
jgi:hypothetical protein